MGTDAALLEFSSLVAKAHTLAWKTRKSSPSDAWGEYQNAGGRVTGAESMLRLMGVDEDLIDRAVQEGIQMAAARKLTANRQ